MFGMGILKVGRGSHVSINFSLDSLENEKVWGSLTSEAKITLLIFQSRAWNFLKNIYLFIYIWLPWVFIAMQGLSLVAAGGGYHLSSCDEKASLCNGFCCYAAGCRCAGSVVAAPRLHRHLGSFWIRDRTLVPCIGRQILNHWTTRKAKAWIFLRVWRVIAIGFVCHFSQVFQERVPVLSDVLCLVRSPSFNISNYIILPAASFPELSLIISLIKVNHL